jgi:hypothetical protein
MDRSLDSSAECDQLVKTNRFRVGFLSTITYSLLSVAKLAFTSGKNVSNVLRKYLQSELS